MNNLCEFTRPKINDISCGNQMLNFALSKKISMSPKKYYSKKKQKKNHISMLGIICDTNLTVFFSFLTPSLKSFQQSFDLLETQ